MAEKLKNNCTLFLKNLNHTGEIHIENGIVTHAVFDNSEGKDALKSFVNERDGIIKMIKDNQKKGNLQLIYNDIKSKIYTNN